MDNLQIAKKKCIITRNNGVNSRSLCRFCSSSSMTPNKRERLISRSVKPKSSNKFAGFLTCAISHKSMIVSIGCDSFDQSFGSSEWNEQRKNHITMSSIEQLVICTKSQKETDKISIRLWIVHIFGDINVGSNLVIRFGSWRLGNICQHYVFASVLLVT